MEPIYVWNNGSVNASAYNGGVTCGAGIDTIIASGRDYINNGTTPKPGYTAYTYPHPLTFTTRTPNPPRNISVQ